MARIGIFGGSFNPPHIGHIEAAQSFFKQLFLDRVLIIPAAVPPHKLLSENAPPPEVRFELCRLAFAEYPWAQVSDIELMRTGPSYTADTVTELKRKYPNDTLYLLVGTDMFLSLDQWYRPEVICSCCTIVAASRTGSEKDGEKLTEQASVLREKLGAEVILLNNEVTELSSTDVRRMLLLNAADTLLVKPVLTEINARGLYAPEKALSELNTDELRNAADVFLKPKRVAHVRGCEETAKRLAEHYSLPIDLLSRAAILHDITKAIPDALQLLLFKKYAILMSDADLKSPPVWHSITGAAAAERIFCQPAAVTDAIRWHTTGRPGMTDMEKVLYLADMIEPTRNFPGVDDIRDKAFQNLDKAMLAALKSTCGHLAESGSYIHPDSSDALDWFKSK